MGIKVIPTPIYTVRSFPLLPIPAPKLDFYSHSHGIPISIGNPIPMVISNVAVDRRNRQTDGRTPYRYIDSAAYTRAVSGIDLPVWALLRTVGGGDDPIALAGSCWSTLRYFHFGLKFDTITFLSFSAAPISCEKVQILATYQMSGYFWLHFHGTRRNGYLWKYWRWHSIPWLRCSSSTIFRQLKDVSSWLLLTRHFARAVLAVAQCLSVGLSLSVCHKYGLIELFFDTEAFFDDRPIHGVVRKFE